VQQTAVQQLTLSAVVRCIACRVVRHRVRGKEPPELQNPFIFGRMNLPRCTVNPAIYVAELVTKTVGRSIAQDSIWRGALCSHGDACEMQYREVARRVCLLRTPGRGLYCVERQQCAQLRHKPTMTDSQGGSIRPLTW
jgi:hypothetical protein